MSSISDNYLRHTQSHINFSLNTHNSVKTFEVVHYRPSLIEFYKTILLHFIAEEF